MDRWKSAVRVLGTTVVLSSLLTSTTAAFRNVKVGEPAPPVAVDDLGGAESKPSFHGRLTVVVFWRSGQSFSLEALRDLGAIDRELGGSEVQIVAVADAEAKPAEVAALAKKEGLSYSMFIDSSRQAQEAYGIIVFPSTGIIGKDGRLVFYQPSRNGNYRHIIGGKLKVLLGEMKEDEFTAKMAQLGEVFGEDREKAQERYKSGLAFFHEGKREEAAAELAQALHLYPEFLDAHLQLGNVLLETGDPTSALHEFLYVKERNPLSPQARLGIGIANLRIGKTEEGIRLLEEAVSLNPDPVRGYAELGRAYEARGDLAGALRAYKRAVAKLLQGRE